MTTSFETSKFPKELENARAFVDLYPGNANDIVADLLSELVCEHRILEIPSIDLKVGSSWVYNNMVGKIRSCTVYFTVLDFGNGETLTFSTPGFLLSCRPEK